jgi:hypothetical protein
LFFDTQYFAVPIRLLWDNWEKFNGEQTNPGDSTDFLIPTMDAPVGGFLNGSLSDYFGIPTEVDIKDINSLHHRAYNLIYNEWFRDENLQDSVTVDTDDGPDNPADYVIKRRGKRHDYFTSCLPWPQKGDAVDLPLGGNVPVIYNTESDQAGENILVAPTSGVTGWDNGGAWNPTTGGNSTVVADMSSSTAATINQLREAFQIQKLYERDARGGTRYTEIVRAHFGVTSPDSRLQRPEYLGGGHSAIQVSPIAQTSSTDATTPQGNLAAQGTVQFNKHGFTKSFTEHCVVIGLACVRADLNYQQGLNRMWSRQTRWDYYWPALAHIGEQAVLSKEIYADGTAQDEDVFGYQERYAEYRYKPSMITGQFRSNFAQPLDSWHLAQDFADRPVLDSDFIEENPPVDRVVAVQDYPHFLFDSYFNFRCARPMPTYSVPGLIDHF